MQIRASFSKRFRVWTTSDPGFGFFTNENGWADNRMHRGTRTFLSRSIMGVAIQQAYVGKTKRQKSPNIWFKYRNIVIWPTLSSVINRPMGVDPWVDRGTCPPLLCEVEGTPCVLSPYFLGVDIFVIWRTPYFDSNTMHRCSLQQFSRNLVS